MTTTCVIQGRRKIQTFVGRKTNMDMNMRWQAGQEKLSNQAVKLTGTGRPKRAVYCV